MDFDQSVALILCLAAAFMSAVFTMAFWLPLVFAAYIYASKRFSLLVLLMFLTGESLGMAMLRLVLIERNFADAPITRLCENLIFCSPYYVPIVLFAYGFGKRTRGEEGFNWSLFLIIEISSVIAMFVSDALFIT